MNMILEWHYHLVRALCIVLLLTRLIIAQSVNKTTKISWRYDNSEENAMIDDHSVHTIIKDAKENDDGIKFDCDDGGRCNLKIDSDYDIWLKSNWEMKLSVNDSTNSIKGDISVRVENIEWEMAANFKYFHVRGVHYGRYGSNYYSCDGYTYGECGTDNTEYYIDGANRAFDSNSKSIIIADTAYTAFLTEIHGGSFFPSTNECACTAGYDDTWFCIQRMMTYDMKENMIGVYELANINRFKAVIKVTAFGQEYRMELDQSATDDVESEIPGFGNIKISGLSDVRTNIDSKILLFHLHPTVEDGKITKMEVIDTYFADSVPEQGVIPQEGVGKYQIVYLGSKDLLFDKTIIKDFSYYSCNRPSTSTLMSKNDNLESVIKQIFMKKRYSYASLGQNHNEKGLLTGTQCCIQIISSSEKEIDIILSNYNKFIDKTKGYGTNENSISKFKLRADGSGDAINIKFSNVVKQKTRMNLRSNDLSIKATTNYADVSDLVLYNCSVFTASTGSFLSLRFRVNTGDEGKRVGISSEDVMFKSRYLIANEANETNDMSIEIIPKSNGSSISVCLGNNNLCRSIDVNYIEPNAGGTDDPDSADSTPVGVLPFTDFITYMYTGIISSIVVTLVFILDFILGCLLLFASWKTIKKTMVLIIIIFTCGKVIPRADAEKQLGYVFPDDSWVIKNGTHMMSKMRCTGEFLDKDEMPKIVNYLNMFKPYLTVKYDDFIESSDFFEYFHKNYIYLHDENADDSQYCTYTDDVNGRGFSQLLINIDSTMSDKRLYTENIAFVSCGPNVAGNRFYRLKYDELEKYNISYGRKFDNVSEKLSGKYLMFYDYSSINYRFNQILTGMGIDCKYDLSNTFYIVPAVGEEFNTQQHWFSDLNGINNKFLLFGKKLTGLGMQIAGYGNRKIGTVSYGEIYVVSQVGWRLESVYKIIEASIEITGGSTVICSEPIIEGESNNLKLGSYVRCMILCNGKCTITGVGSDKVINIKGNINTDNSDENNRKKRMIKGVKENNIINSVEGIVKDSIIIENERKSYNIFEKLKMKRCHDGCDNCCNGEFIGNGLLTLKKREKEIETERDIRKSLKIRREIEKSGYYDIIEMLKKSDKEFHTDIIHKSRYRSMIKDNIGFKIEGSYAIIEDNIFEVENGNDIGIYCDPTNGTRIICHNEMGLFIINNTELSLIKNVDIDANYHTEFEFWIPKDLLYRTIKISKREEIGSLYWNTNGDIDCYGGRCIIKPNETGHWMVLKDKEGDHYGSGLIQKMRKSKFDNFDINIKEYKTDRGILTTNIQGAGGCNKCKFSCMMECARNKMETSYKWFFWSPLYIIGFILLWILIINVIYMIVYAGFKEGSKSFLRNSYKTIRNAGYKIADGDIPDYMKVWRRKGRHEKVESRKKEKMEDKDGIYRRVQRRRPRMDYMSDVPAGMSV